jgi:hypothetical protein
MANLKTRGGVSADAWHFWRRIWRSSLARVALAACVGTGAIVSCGVDKTPSEAVGVSREALTTTVSFQQFVLPSGSYSGAADATLRENAPTNNDDTTEICGADGDNGGGVDKSCVISWNVSAIPPGSVVTAATITFYIVNGTNLAYGVHELLRTWDATQVTWNIAKTGQNWATPGANGATDRGAVLGTVIGATDSTQTVTLNAAGIARVRAWIDNPSSNAGVIVANTTITDGIDLGASDNLTAARRPKLTVTYDSGGGTGGTGGGSGSGGTAGSASGSGGTATLPNLLVAFIGDQGNNADAQAVLSLIASQGAHAVVHNGDFDYANQPTQWGTMIDATLGVNFPYFAVLGNHEKDEPFRSQYVAALEARTQRIPEMRDNCTGSPGFASTCRFRGLLVVQSCVGLNEIDPVRCGRDAAQPINHIHNALANDNSIWSVCNWHKVQAQMQIGDKTDEAGWQAYRECMNAGAIIVTAHSHTYSRSFTLTDIANTNVAANKGAIGTHDAMQVAPGRTFAVVTGIGGRSLELRVRTDAWWATYYTKDFHRPSGATPENAIVGKQGALFIKFNVGGDPRRAEGYVRTITGLMMDTFTIQAL